jgi:hypothetical protein
MWPAGTAGTAGTAGDSYPSLGPDFHPGKIPNAPQNRFFGPIIGWQKTFFYATIKSVIENRS